jgi:hypothetical protein
MQAGVELDIVEDGLADGYSNPGGGVVVLVLVVGLR